MNKWYKITEREFGNGYQLLTSPMQFVVSYSHRRPHEETGGQGWVI